MLAEAGLAVATFPTISEVPHADPNETQHTVDKDDQAGKAKIAEGMPFYTNFAVIFQVAPSWGHSSHQLGCAREVGQGDEETRREFQRAMAMQAGPRIQLFCSSRHDGGILRLGRLPASSVDLFPPDRFAQEVPEGLERRGGSLQPFLPKLQLQEPQWMLICVNRKQEN